MSVHREKHTNRGELSNKEELDLNTVYPTNSINEAINPLNTELNPSCHLLALLGAHHIFYVSGLRVKHEGRDKRNT